MINTDLIAHIKTSVAASKGFELYAARNGDSAARACCYGRLAHMGFLYFAGETVALEKDLSAKPW